MSHDRPPEPSARYPRSLEHHRTLRLLHDSAQILRRLALVELDRGDVALAAECEERALVTEHQRAVLRDELATLPQYAGSRRR